MFNVDPSKHRCLIFGTDGLWNVLSADTAISNVYGTEKHNIEMKSLEVNTYLFIYYITFFKFKNVNFRNKIG